MSIFYIFHFDSFLLSTLLIDVILESGKASLIGENAIDETKQSELVLAMLYQSKGSDGRLKKYAAGDDSQIREIWIEDYINLIDNIKVPVELFIPTESKVKPPITPEPVAFIVVAVMLPFIVVFPLIVCVSKVELFPAIKLFNVVMLPPDDTENADPIFKDSPVILSPMILLLALIILAVTGVSNF